MDEISPFCLSISQWHSFRIDVCVFFVQSKNELFTHPHAIRHLLNHGERHSGKSASHDVKTQQQQERESKRKRNVWAPGWSDSPLAWCLWPPPPWTLWALGWARSDHSGKWYLSTTEQKVPGYCALNYPHGDTSRSLTFNVSFRDLTPCVKVTEVVKAVTTVAMRHLQPRVY